MSATVIKTALPIRRPAAEVFNAFVDPDVITRFWLDKTSGPLKAGAVVEWQFMVPGAKDTVTVLDFQRDRRLVLQWSDGSTVTLDFAAHADGSTVLSIETSAFKPEDAGQVVPTTEGYCIVMCDLKTLLESGRSANLVKDKAEWMTRMQAQAGGDAGQEGLQE